MNRVEQDAPDTLQAAALQHQAAGRWSEALDLWQPLLALAPDRIEALANRASCLRRLGRHAEARQDYERALALEPEHIAIRYNYANLLQAVGAHEEAEASFVAALIRDPHHIPSLVNLGRLLRERKRYDEAEARFREALALDPGQPQAHRAMARLLHRSPRPAEARPHYEAALEATPDERALRSDYGVLLNQLGEHDAAATQWQRVLQSAPEDAVALNNLGAQARKLRRPQEALAWLQRAQRAQPGEVQATCNLAQVLLDLGQISRAAALIEPIALRHPDHADVKLTLGFARTHQGAINEAVAAFLDSAEAAPDASTPVSNALFASLYNETTAEDDAALHRRLATRLRAPAAGAAPPLTPLTPASALRVGFVSPDFRSHPVACFFAPMLPHFERTRIETVCYSTTLVEDEVSVQIRGDAHHWRACSAMDDAALAAQIRADRCDILVDLAGHTAQNRLAMFRARPTPLQLTWMGYPATTGLPEMDGLIADYTLLPPDQANGCSERVLYLDRPWISYQPPGGAPPLAPPPCLSGAGLRFGSFNNYPKLSDATIALWSQLLLATPGAHLLLRSLALADPELRRQLPQRFARHGVNPTRIEALPPVQGQRATLEAYNEIDIALDPLPFNGFTTSCDALWMGVPVVTLEGHSYRTRVGLALQTALGDRSCVARDAQDYVAIAVNLAADPQKLADLRAGLRARFMASPLGDAAGLAAAMTRLFEAEARR